MESKRKITISPDILHEIGYDEEGISVSVENDLVFWCDSENPVHVEGMSAWQEWFESVTDFVAGHMDATSIDMIKWHCKGLQLASELKKKLPESVEVWYDRPFEDKSDILQGPVRMFKCFSPEMMRLLGEMVLNDDEYLNEFHKKWNEECLEERYLARHIKFTAEYLKLQSKRLDEQVKQEEMHKKQ